VDIERGGYDMEILILSKRCYSRIVSHILKFGNASKSPAGNAVMLAWLAGKEKKRTEKR
jgi:hypothetical protein